MTIYLLTFSLSLLLCMVATRFVRDLAFSHGYVSLPTSGRHVHAAPIPRLGGIAIFVTVAAICTSRELYAHQALNINGLRLIAILAAGAIVFAIGLADDLRSVRPYAKILAQVVSAGIFFLSGPRLLHINSVFGSTLLGTLTSLLGTIGFVVLISNAFNLIDGLDGLAGGSALCSTTTLFILSLFTQHHFISLIMSSLAGTILGFLVFNMSPASIFLGDCGSLFLGVVLAESCLTLQAEAPFVLGLFLPMCCFALPLLDTALAIFRRILNGHPVFSADGEHIHHKLLERGLSHRQAVVLLCGLSALFSSLIVVLVHLNGPSRSLLVSFLALAVLIALAQLRYREFHELGRIFRRIATQRQIVRNDLALRRATERLQGEPSIEGVCRVLMSAFEQSEFDGFTLELQAVPLENRGLFLPTDGGQFAFGWRRFESKRAGFIEDNWRIQLKLQAGGQYAGDFTVHRCSLNQPLLVDLDILTNDFRVALSNAIERVSVGRRPSLPVREEPRTATA